MKFTIKRNSFQKLLENAYEAIPLQSPIASLKNFLIEVTDTNICVIASDGTLTIQAILNVGDEDNAIINSIPGKVQIPAKYLLDIIKNLESNIVTLELVDSSLLFVSDEISQFKLNIFRAEEYPDIDIEATSVEKIIIKTNDFIKLYNSTSFAVATRGPKELFYGVNITAKDNKLTFVATDSFRLARKYVNIDGEHHVSITVPCKTLNVVSKFSTYSEVIMIIDTNKVLFKVGNYTISSKLYNGEFPNVDRIIPDGMEYNLTVNAKEFISSIERITIVGNTKILVNASSEQVEISSKDLNVGSSKEVLKGAEFEGNRFSIIFNAKFVIEAIKALNTERVTLAFAAENRAFLVKSTDETITQVITPIRSLGD
jgi:DNA polymerase-3 subunit beta